VQPARTQAGAPKYKKVVSFSAGPFSRQGIQKKVRASRCLSRLVSNCRTIEGPMCAFDGYKNHLKASKNDTQYSQLFTHS
jgi:hypothetical protein